MLDGYLWPAIYWTFRRSMPAAEPVGDHGLADTVLGLSLAAGEKAPGAGSQ